MIPFQWLFGGLLSAALAIELILQIRHQSRRSIGLLRGSVWATALVLVLYPNILQTIAVKLSIGRGADFLLYMLAVSFPTVCFYLLHSIEKQRQQITQLVRALAQKTPYHEPRDASRSDAGHAG
ncbi:DUF2304 domain-containing protein [Rhodopirellula sp. MGV]|uniref:DUF2304 domain-containing protein n=1 Tax=Rhodopirellula sp. MGV TaxID=2023130 RepID=UPI000B96B74E|nr:DUF2304 domain-containing protein [Rhodopirellula sp. MGV]OYP37471.1 hypothetical protein CGZ80_04905 [Rhodopirellula sp. MGV]PNY37873.1 DUF2304 domain-containing protein [Rhodopirellula baltica]